MEKKKVLHFKMKLFLITKRKYFLVKVDDMPFALQQLQRRYIFRLFFSLTSDHPDSALPDRKSQGTGKNHKLPRYVKIQIPMFNRRFMTVYNVGDGVYKKCGSVVLITVRAVLALICFGWV